MRPTSKRSARKAASLFDGAASSGGDARVSFEERIRAFARVVAQRHRSRPADTVQLVLALRGYCRALALFEDVPSLDEGIVAMAIAEYATARGVRPAAA